VRDTVDKFLFNRRVGNCTPSTLEVYAQNLHRFAEIAPAELEGCSPEIVQAYLDTLRLRLKPISVHQHYRTLRTFFSWCGGAGFLQANPLRGFRMKVPKTLPHVPESDDIRRLLTACAGTFEGKRNRALIALLVDSALRISEALALRIQDLDFGTGTISVRNGKGQKDSVAHFETNSARYLRAWLAMRPGYYPDDFVFVNRSGERLQRHSATQILYRLSHRAGLPRKIGPHALRHFAATSILRQTGDLDLVRRVLRHESLAMALRYTHLTGADISKKFRRASPFNNLDTES
jgi:site-specific recombinase XerD